MKAGELATPEFFVVRSPIVNDAKRPGIQPVEALSPVLATQHQPDLEQDREVLRHRRIGEPRVLDEVTDGCFPPGQEVEHQAPIGVGDGVEDIGGRCAAAHRHIITPNAKTSSLAF